MSLFCIVMQDRSPDKRCPRYIDARGTVAARYPGRAHLSVKRNPDVAAHAEPQAERPPWNAPLIRATVAERRRMPRGCR